MRLLACLVEGYARMRSKLQTLFATHDQPEQRHPWPSVPILQEAAGEVRLNSKFLSSLPEGRQDLSWLQETLEMEPLSTTKTARSKDAAYQI